MTVSIIVVILTVFMCFSIIITCLIFYKQMNSKWERRKLYHLKSKELGQVIVEEKEKEKEKEKEVPTNYMRAIENEFERNEIDLTNPENCLENQFSERIPHAENIEEYPSINMNSNCQPPTVRWTDYAMRLPSLPFEEKSECEYSDPSKKSIERTQSDDYGRFLPRFYVRSDRFPFLSFAN